MDTTTEDSLRQRIAAELNSRETLAASSHWLSAIATGQASRALEDALFFGPPSEFLHQVALLPDEISRLSPPNLPLQADIIRFVSGLAIALRSHLPSWRLLTILSRQELETAAESLSTLTTDLAARWPGATAAVLATWHASAAARLKSEGLNNPIAAADALVEKGVSGYLEAISQAIQSGYLRSLADLRFTGRSRTEIGNDYAAYLDHAMLLGASFVTTNPPLVDTAWDANPTHWNGVVDAIVAAHHRANVSDLARLVTLEVVLANMRLLRPIFLLTKGSMGYVSLQVNPKEHANTSAMIADAEAIYADLTAKLAGGVPNVVFKLPATQAGLQACEHLTNKGIGVNITINFGLFQEMAFAPMIRKGHALVSYLTVMNGRLSYPVRDELLARLGQPAQWDVDEGVARRAAAWAGVAIVKRLVARLAADGYDLTRVRPLVASLRWYSGQVYEGLPSPCPDVTECIGVPVLTVFPNVRRSLDDTASLPLAGNQVAAPVPAEVLDVLSHSELFRQAYWLPGDTCFRPEHPIFLKDEAATAAWQPVRTTIDEFSRAYDRFCQKILARQAASSGEQAVAG